MKLYQTRAELFNAYSCPVIAIAVYSEDNGEFLGYRAEYI